MRTVVGVLRGGPSREYEVSLKSGASVLEHLDRERYEPRDIFVDRAGQWHVHGRELASDKALAGVDVAFNAMHGDYGEDGRLQRELGALGVPYTGSSSLASALAYNKHQAKEAVAKRGVKVPYGQVVDLSTLSDVEGLAQNLFRSFPHPAVVKPVAAGSFLGVYKAESYHGLEHALREAAAHSPKILIEEYIPGREATVGVIDNFRGEEVYALIPTPDTFSFEEKTELAELAKQAHKALGLAHYSDSDFVVSKRGIYYLETHSHPKLHDESKLWQGLQSVGATLSHFLDHIISLARNGTSR